MKNRRLLQFFISIFILAVLSACSRGPSNDVLQAEIQQRLDQ